MKEKYPTALLILVALIMTSCLSIIDAEAAEIAPFIATDFEYQLDNNSDPIIRTGCNQIGSTRICTGRNPRTEITLGAEFAF